MRALIVGAGAVGCYLAARLRLGGHDVVLLARQAQVESLRSDGITLRAEGQEWPVSVDAAVSTGDGLLARPFELAIVAVKSFATAEAISSLREIGGCAESTIMTVQNGLGNEEALAKAFGEQRIAAGALTTAVERHGADVVAARSGGLAFAPVGVTPHNWLIAAFAGTGMRVAAAGDWQSLKWSKLCINLIANGVCAALDEMPDRVYAEPLAFAIERSCLVEAFQTMRALKIRSIGLPGFPVNALAAAVDALPASALRAVIRGRVVRARGGKLPSLLQDLRAGKKRTEAGDLYGAVATRAALAGRSAPTNAAVARVVDGIAAGTEDWAKYRGSPASLSSAVRS